METETTALSEFPSGGKAIVEQILAPEERKKSERVGLWDSQSGVQVGKLTIRLRSLEIEKFTRVHQVYQFNQNSLASPYDGHEWVQRQTHR